MRTVIHRVSWSLAFLVVSAASRADEANPVVIWPTLTPAGDSAGPLALHRPLDTEKALGTRAQELDTTLRDAIQDLGFTLYVAEAGPSGTQARDTEILARAARGGRGGTWVVSPRIEQVHSNTYLLRMVVSPPRSQELRVRVETVAAANLSVRALVMLRQLLRPESAAARAEAPARVEPIASTVERPRSAGRAILAINAAAFGGALAYRMQRASGSDDPRVLYPLLTLGTGVGIASALLVSEEWDVTPGNAWFLAAGAWWGASAGILVAGGQHVEPSEDRYGWGAAGGFLGVGLATVALVGYRMEDGEAVLAHSGGAVGMLFGGLGELAFRGATDRTPQTGMGYGAAIGLVSAGFLATRVRTSPSRVLLVDLGVGLGALAGAAAASPLVFDQPTEGRTSAWLGVTLGGAVAGGAVSWWLTRSMTAEGRAHRGAPIVGVIGQSATPWGTVPAYGLGYSGVLE
ncbi:MAG: hypothetical protein WCI05_02140 [Myxococcales bacterium]